MIPRLIPVFALACSMMVNGTALSQVNEPKLTGIFFWENTRHALLELPSSSGDVLKSILSEGKSRDGYLVIRIGETSVTLEVPGGKPLTLELPPDTGESVAGRTFRLWSTHVQHVLSLYQEIAGRTVIIPLEMPDKRISLKSGVGLSAEDALRALANALSNLGFKIKHVGTKFAFALTRESERRLPDLRDPPVMLEAEDKFPPGLISLRNADWSQVLEVYQELADRKMVCAYALRGGKINLTSQTELSRSETAWMLEAALLLDGVAVVPGAGKTAFAVPAEKSFLLPRFDAQAAAAYIWQKNAGILQLNISDAEQLLAAYAKLLGREPLPLDPRLVGKKLAVQTRQPLHPAEAGFALQGVARLNGLQFVNERDKYVKLVVATNTPPATSQPFKAPTSPDKTLPAPTSNQ
jgi:hypothetical protein